MTRPPASECPSARTSLSLASASRSTSPIHSPSGLSAVRRRRADSAAGTTRSKSTVRDPLHLTVIRQEGDRPAYPVAQRLRIAVGVVGSAEAVLVVGDPRNGRVVGAKGRAREQQPEAGRAEGPAGSHAPGGQIAHVVRLVGDQQGRPAASGQPVRLRPRPRRLGGGGGGGARAR